MAVVNQWPAAKAKAKFAEVLDAAEKKGPQSILKNGKLKAIIVSPEQWDNHKQPTQSLAEFLLNSPLRGSGIKIERLKGKIRPVKF